VFTLIFASVRSKDKICVYIAFNPRRPRNDLKAGWLGRNGAPLSNGWHLKIPIVCVYPSGNAAMMDVLIGGGFRESLHGAAV